MANNPLSSERPQRPAPEDTMMKHAQAWKRAHSMSSEDLESQIKIMDYGLPLFGALAGNPKTTAKDVIKATAAAVADMKISPSMGVKVISGMPADTDKLRPWLRNLYSDALAMAVHSKAALMSQQGAPQGQGLMPQQQAQPMAAPDPMMGRPA